MSDPVVDQVMANEGGYADDPADAGGPTKYGITVATLSAWRNRPCTAADVQALSWSEAEQIFRQNYVLDGIRDAGLRVAAADAAGLFGRQRIIRALQAILDVQVDGIFGAETATAINAREPRGLINALSMWRIGEHAQRCVADPSQLKFLVGWLGRAARFVK